MASDSITGGQAVPAHVGTQPCDSAAGPRLADLVELAAAQLPEATAVIFTADRVAVSYRDLVRLVDDLAGQLTRAGLRQGERVALRSGSNLEFVVALLAASRANLIVVPLDPALPVADQRARAGAAGARVVLIDGTGPGDRDEPAVRWWPIAVSVARDTGILSVHLDAAGEPTAVASAPQGSRADDAMIMFTGGTTGLPKMVPWTRANIATSIRSIIAGYRLSPQDATVAVMPLYHGHGLMAALLSTLVSGARCCCRLAENSRRTHSGTTFTSRTPPGTPRCPRSTRSCWSAPRRNGKPTRPAGLAPHCASSAVAARHSRPKPRKRCMTSSPPRCCAHSA